MTHSHLPQILIVDDEEMIRKLLSDVIRLSGMEAVEASDCDSALEALGRTSIDLVLLDVRMPGTDGFRVLRKIRRGHPRLPVILMTGEGKVADAVDAMKGGAADYLTKPLNHLELLAKIQALLLPDRREREIIGQKENHSAASRTAFPCPHCFSENLAKSQMRGWEPLALLLLHRPYRCVECGERCWRLCFGRWLVAVWSSIKYMLFDHRWGKNRNPAPTVVISKIPPTTCVVPVSQEPIDMI